MRPRLTRQEYEILHRMNTGMYLMKKENPEGGNTEGLAIRKRIAGVIKAGTIERLLNEGLVRASEFEYKDGVRLYFLTNEGRLYRNNEGA